MSVTVITTIQKSTQSIKDHSALGALIVVGDKKTPNHNENYKYLNSEEQDLHYQELSKLLPWNSYSRKNIGYLEAIKISNVIFESDDDNSPLPNFKEIPTGQIKLITSPEWPNPYKWFAKNKVWPRGYPLSKINNDGESPLISDDFIDSNKIAVWQGLTIGDPDVDSIYRLTNNLPVSYNENEPISFGRDCWCPFNSQATIWKKQAFKYMYLPSTVSFRYCDILRSLITQYLCWKEDTYVGFIKPNTFSERNEHDLMGDFSDEVSMFNTVLLVKDILKEKNPNDIFEAYMALYKENIVKSQEIPILKTWLNLIC